MIFISATNVAISNTYTIIFSCVLSYILLSISELVFIWIKCLSQFRNNIYVRSVISITIGLILAIIFSMCFHTKKLKEFMKSIAGKTQYDEIWRDVIDLEGGSNLKIYIKNENYYVFGHFRNIEEHKTDPYIAVFGYGKFDKITNKLIDEESNHMDDDLKDDSNIFVIRMSNVEHMEIK